MRSSTSRLQPRITLNVTDDGGWEWHCAECKTGGYSPVRRWAMLEADQHSVGVWHG